MIHLLQIVLKRDRLVVSAGLFGLTLLAWCYMVVEARAMAMTGICHCAGMKMSGPDMSAWSLPTLIPLFLMWAEMMVAMMIPSAVPTILTFATVNRKRREREQPFVPTGIFMLGYLAVWALFSAFAAVAQWGLHALTLLSPRMVSTSPLFGGMLLIAAGLFQWSPLKSLCLIHCRSPLRFLLTEWREGSSGAFWMGVRHGGLCTGCCWVLMTLLFVVGVMNMWWVAVIAALVLVEKIAPKGLVLGRLAGLALVAWGIWLIL